MLKLEKRSRGAPLAVVLREDEPFLSRIMIFALSFALFLHGGAFLLFKVIPFHVSSSFLFAPISVQSDLLSVPVTAQVTTEKGGGDEFLTPPFPFQAATDWLPIASHSSLYPSLSLDNQAIERVLEVTRPAFHPSLPMVLKGRWIEFSISGDLAEIQVVSASPLLEETKTFLVQEEPLYATFGVKLDGSTGEIFWIDRSEMSGNPAVDRLMEQVALQMRFEACSGGIIDGKIHFRVWPKASQK